MNNNIFENEVLDFRPVSSPPFKRFTKKQPVYFDNNTQLKVIPLEEHFENFVEVVADSAVENFKWLKKIINRRAAIKDQKKKAKTDVIQAKADKERILANAEAQRVIIEANAAAAQQAAATQQLQQQLQPSLPPVTAAQTPLYQSLPQFNPQAAGSSGGQWEDIPQDNVLKEPLQPLATSEPKPTATPKQAADKKKKMILFAVIAIVVIAAAWYFTKKKK